MNTRESSVLETKIKVFKGKPGKGAQLLGFAELIINRSFVIKDIRILKSLKENGQKLFISFPNKKGTGEASDQYFDVAHPVTPEAYQLACDLILREYGLIEGKA